MSLDGAKQEFGIAYHVAGQFGHTCLTLLP